MIFTGSFFQIKKYSSPRGDGNFVTRLIEPVIVKLRNIAPREGTETRLLNCSSKRIQIKKYSSPRGDGNATETGYLVSGFWIKKYSSPRGDGNCGKRVARVWSLWIKKYSSPRGDGNDILPIFLALFLLLIKKYSSPRGDGNSNASIMISWTSSN